MDAVPTIQGFGGNNCGGGLLHPVGPRHRPPLPEEYLTMTLEYKRHLIGQPGAGYDIAVHDTRGRAPPIL